MRNHKGLIGIRNVRRKYHYHLHYYWNHRKKTACTWLLVLAFILSIACMVAFLPEHLSRNLTDIDKTKITAGRASINDTGIIDLYLDQVIKPGQNYYNLNSPHFQQDLDSTWVRVSDDVYVYSAHLDTRFSGPRGSLNSSYALIRIIGLLGVPPMRQIIKEDPLKWLRIKDETDLSNKYLCKIFYTHPETKKFVFLHGDILTHSIFEEGIKVFAAVFFNCYVNASKVDKVILTNKIYVAVYPSNVSGYPDKIIPVQTHILSQEDYLVPFPKERKNSLPGISICVRPLFGPMDDLNRLMQFISYYSHMGITRFNFYDLSISPEVRKYLVRDLPKLWGINVSLRKWNLPSGNTSELWDYGSLASLNDCLYRSMGSKYVLFIDIDEFIVPQHRNHQDLHDIISHHSKFHELRIRNTFFCNEFCGSRNESRVSLGIFSCFIRTKRIWSVKLRTKFIVKPRYVLTVGHHMVTSFARQKVEEPQYILKYSKVASKDLALMNHYRECKSLGSVKSPVLNRLSIEDKTIQHFFENMKILLPSTKV